MAILSTITFPAELFLLGVHLQMSFWKVLKEIWVFFIQLFYSSESKWQKVSTSSGNSLMPSRWKANKINLLKPVCIIRNQWVNTLRPKEKDRHFPDDIFKCIFLNENVWISIKISLKFVPKCPINNIPALVQIMACRRPGDKPLSEPMMVRLLMHICVTRPQWVKSLIISTIEDSRMPWWYLLISP